MRLLLLLLLVAGAAYAQLDETTKGYQIKVRYPKIPVVEAWARSQVASFKKDFEDATGGKPDRVPWSLDIGYTEPFRSKHVQVVYCVGSSFEGGAHPAPFMASFVVDLKTGKALTLADLFQGEYLQAFSTYARAELARRDISSEADWIAKGTEPKPESFSVAYPTQRGFMLVFPPYQVAPYVAGPQEVLVPWQTLAPYRASREILD